MDYTEATVELLTSAVGTVDGFATMAGKSGFGAHPVVALVTAFSTGYAIGGVVTSGFSYLDAQGHVEDVPADGVFKPSSLPSQVTTFFSGLGEQKTFHAGSTASFR